MIRPTIALAALVISAAALLGSAVAAPPVHRTNLWAGNWTTSTGNLGLRLMDGGEIADAKHEARAGKLYDKLPCHGPQYYRGGYFSTADAGKIIGCGTPTRLSGRYASIKNASAGSFAIKVSSKSKAPLAFTGSYTPDPAPGKKAKTQHWSGRWVKDFGGDGCCGVQAMLTVATSTIGLLKTETLRATPASATSFTFELKRAREQSWHRLATGRRNTFTFVARIPGHFDIRVTLTASGKRVVSAPQSLTVQFPSYDDIVADANVREATKAAWQRTIRATTPQGVREEGFWIRLDTCNGRYSHTPPVEGDSFVPAPPPALQPGVKLGPVPSDTPAALPLGCGTYTVAEFHTHPGTAFFRYAKGVGPSPEDNAIAPSRDLPGLVYDYIESEPGSGEIPDHWPLNSPARIYHSGQDRRTTPR